MFYVVIITIIAITIAVIASRQSRSTSAGNTFESFIAGNNFGSIGKGESIIGELRSTHIYFYDKNNDSINTSLPYSKICDVRVVSDKDIIEKAKSVGGRAVIGGLVLGPIGAIVGGMSGIGNKTSTQINNYIVINYNSGSDVSAIMLKVNPLSSWSSWIDELKRTSHCTNTSVTL